MSATKRTISFRQRAAIMLAQLYRVAEVHRAAGEILPPAPWLQVLANILSSAPEGYDGDRRGRNAPTLFGLSKSTLSLAALRCGLDATVEMLEAQVADTRAWRERESGRIGHHHYAPMRPDKIGELLGVTDATREAAQAWNIGTLGGSSAARAKAAKERDRAYQKRCRAEQGAVPRTEYEMSSLSRLKPWEAEGISRRTWERRRTSYAGNDASPSATNKGLSHVASPSVASP